MNADDYILWEAAGDTFIGREVEHEESGWRTKALVGRRNGSNEPDIVHSLTIEPMEPGQTPAHGITTTVLQRTPLDWLVSSSARRDMEEHYGGQAGDATSGAWEELATAVERWSLSGSKDRTPLLVFVSVRYLFHSALKGRGAVGVLAAELSTILGEEVKRDTARDWIAAARRREFLSKGTSGRAGASPGPKLKDALQVVLGTESER